jgi:hypothetical protein
LRITTYKDLLLKLYNRVYRLQVRENIGLEPNLKKTAARHNNELLAELIERLSILMKSLEPIRHRIAHGGYHMDYDLILIEAEEAGRGSGRSGIMPEEEYAAVQKNLLTRNILEMYEIEKTMATFVIAVFKKLYPVRRLFEKQLQRKDQF